MTTSQYTLVCEKIKRWKSRLKRAVNAIDKLERQKARMEKKASQVTLPPVLDLAKQIDAIGADRRLQDWQPSTEDFKIPDDDLAIPTFLQRKTIDPVAEQIMKEQADTKRKKAQGRIAKMKAKAAGDLKKMPLTGRAALDAIREAQKKTPA